MLQQKSKIVLALFALIIFLSLGFSQQPQPHFNVAVINPVKAIQGTAEGNKALMALQKKEQQIRSELGKLDMQANDLATKIQTQGFALSIEAQQKMSRELESIKIKRKRAEEDFSREYQELEFKLINPIKKGMLSIIKDVSKNKGYSVVFDLSISGVAYYDPDFDITEEVIQKYNAADIEKK
jgi:Skp family chaperone for outer membrane proteins